MDNAQKAIMIGVGLFITIIIISAVLLITNLGTGLIEDASGEVGLMTDNLKRELLTQYDGKTLRYDELLQCVQKYSSSDSVGIVVDLNGTLKYYGGVKLTVKSGTLTAESVKVGGMVIDATNGPITKAAKNTSPSAYADLLNGASAESAFKTAIVYNAAGAVVGIVAVQL